MLVADTASNGLRLAQDNGAACVSISGELAEIGPDIAMFAHRPAVSAVILASHWLAGSALFPALQIVSRLFKAEAIRIGALFDEHDASGPAAFEDMDRARGAAAAAMTFEDGKLSWTQPETAAGLSHDGWPGHSRPSVFSL